MKHTETPWKAYCKMGIVRDVEPEESAVIAVCDSPKDRAFIVHAVNMHEELVKAVEWLMEDTSAMPIFEWRTKRMEIRALITKDAEVNHE
jgi:hypothetical protein